jgi:hypothetical protein
VGAGAYAPDRVHRGAHGVDRVAGLRAERVEVVVERLALRFFTTIATLGTPQDITLQELRVECFYPADEATEELARRLAEQRDAAGA